MIELRIFFSGFNSFLYYLNTDNLICNRCKKLGNSACSRIKIEYNSVVSDLALIVETFDISADSLIQHFCAQAVRLEE